MGRQQLRLMRHSPACRPRRSRWPRATSTPRHSTRHSARSCPMKTSRSSSNLEKLLGGLLLGQDLRTRILPQLGPGVIAYVESPPEALDAGTSATARRHAASSRPFAQVLVASLRNEQPAGGRIRCRAAGGATAAARNRKRPAHACFPWRRSTRNGTTAGRRSRPARSPVRT